MNKLTVHLGGKKHILPFEGSPLLADLLRAQGFPVRTPCGGAGVCGRCGVLAAGSFNLPPINWRVPACKTRLTGSAEVWLEEAAQLHNITLANALPLIPLDPMGQGLGMAVDIGTTTIAVMLLDLASGEVITTLGDSNPQVTLSDNVIGRIAAALDGQGKALQKAVRSAIDGLRLQSCAQVGVQPEDIRFTVITGNTAMLYFYTGQHPKALSAAPLLADRLFGEWQGSTFLPRCIGAFLGADLLMAILSSGMCGHEETALLADIGTNGELALWHKGRLWCAAAAAGPAFEGGGIRQGLGSVAGAIDTIRAEGQALAVTTIGGGPAVGICGSGLIDAAAAMLRAGLMDETGRLSGDSIQLTEKVSLYQDDLRHLQLAKGAIAAAMGALCQAAGIRTEEIARFYLAGGFGAHMNPDSAASIGLIPAALLQRTVPLGNAALSGAAMLLLNKGNIERSFALAAQAQPLNLSGNPVFAELFMQRMLFEPF